MNETAVKIAQITGYSRTFKGLGLMVLGATALLFAYYMKKRWNEPKSFGFYLFIAVGAIILVYGLIVLALRPNWWALPY